MGFSRREPDEDLKWNQIKARLARGEEVASPEEREPADASDADDDDRQEEVLAERRPPRSRASQSAPVTPVRSAVDPELANERLPALKRAANRVKRLQKAAIDPTREYRVGQRIFDPVAQKFGEVAFSAPGYVRILLSDGSQSAHGKPPLDDRRNFVFANFDRMDNKTMAEILGISVHTMRRLCHEYGLKRQGRKKKTA